MKIINNLKGIRTQRKIAQKQLAMDTGYDPRTIRRVELGECCPSAEFMFDMSDYFGN
ncbi:helix-turn-helix transcriptional regulator [Agathobacter rectalis]|uniref:helix-turn-helix transcriptional regulator n=1 Tax=Agathobacter rectalis TaxID=39491 RepID=UPI0036F3C76F